MTLFKKKKSVLRLESHDTQKAKQKHKVGMAPGTLVLTGESKSDHVKISVINYNRDIYLEHEPPSIDACFNYIQPELNTWINIDGLHETVVIEKIGHYFGLHPLLLEDILDIRNRPKFEDHGDHIFFIIKMLYFNQDNTKIQDEQMSFLLGKNYVISFQEVVGDVLEPVRERLRNTYGKIRFQRVDYLFYALLDVIVDHYFILLDQLNENVDNVEDQLIKSPDTEMLEKIQEIKKDYYILRKSGYPLREAINNLRKTDSSLIDPANIRYFDDLNDHIVHVVDIISAYRETVFNLIDIYHISVSNVMNRVMKVLALISTIFMPVTFVAGVYGMNFHNMPELRWEFGYFIILFVMGMVILGMVLFFKRKKWF